MSDLDEKSDPPGGAPAWMATMADLMSLLLCFFVLLLSFANMDVVKFRMMLGSVQNALGVTTQHPGENETRSTTPIELSERESTPYLDVLNEPTQPTQPQHSIDSRLVDEIHSAISGLGIERMVETSTDKRGVVVRVKSPMLFAPGALDLRSESFIFLDEVARLVEAFPYKVWIEGHTDNTPVNRPEVPSNWHLAAFRAIATLRYLEKKSNVDPGRFAVGGYGSTRPLASNATPEGRAENRRVEFVFER